MTQRTLATYLLERGAHYLFTVKNNQPTLRLDIALQFATKINRQPDFAQPPTLAHGRIEQRAIWTTTALNEYVNFPASAKSSCSAAHGTTRSPERPALKPSMASPATPPTPPIPKSS